MNIFYHILEAQRDWYKPEWIYESMPWFYMSAGTFTITWLHNGMGIFSGGMLIMTSAVVLSQRYSYRQRKAKEKAEKEQEHRQLKMLGTLVWRSSFSCGCKLIDEQHQFLFSEANRIINAIKDDEQELDYDKTLRKLLRDIQRHFRDEEKFLTETIPETARLHKEEHQRIFSRIMSLIDDIREGDATGYEMITFLIIDAVTKHTLKDDLKWKEMLRNR